MLAIVQYNMYNCEIIFQGPIVTIRTEWNKPQSTACYVAPIIVIIF